MSERSMRVPAGWRSVSFARHYSPPRRRFRRFRAWSAINDMSIPASGRHDGCHGTKPFAPSGTIALCWAAMVEPEILAYYERNDELGY